MKHFPRTLPLVFALALLAAAARAQDGPPPPAEAQPPDAEAVPAPTEEDVAARLEQLERQVDVLSDELERVELGDAFGTIGESRFGFGRAASKVYEREVSGLSVGGYGEILFQERSHDTDVWDALRGVLYVGYKFDERWIFNSEIELEHGTTDSSSGTTDSGGSASLEFAYIDHMIDDGFNLRGGLLLVPMGLVNEQHEPISRLTANRPQTEQRILPTTWRENGLGAFGDLGPFSYRAYVVNGLAGEEFAASGLRGGRQKGNRAAAEDLAFVARVDWVEVPGVVVGGSVYHGDSGQGAEGLPDLGTTIYELHADVRQGPWTFRALAAMADIDDAAEFNAATGESLAEELEGAYVELGYDLFADLLPVEGQQLELYGRWETIDTQAELPSGSTPASGFDDEIRTIGLSWQPIDQVVVKLDYEDWDGVGDQLNFLIGYVF